MSLEAQEAPHVRTTVCFWCGSDLPKSVKRVAGALCSDNCTKDSAVNKWPSWVSGRIGPEPDRNWHMTGEFLCMSAPNRYRQMYRKKLPRDEINEAIIAKQAVDYPHLSNPMGIDIDYPSWDQVLIWRGPTMKDVA